MRPQTRVVQSEGHDQAHVELGGILQALLVAGCLGASVAILGIPVLAMRVSADEEQTKKLAEKVERIESNQHEIDTNQRLLRQGSEWNGDKLDRLLDAQHIPRVEQPDLPPSSLQESTGAEPSD
jgi:hypothetical protein